MLPDFDHADRIGEFDGNRKTRRAKVVEGADHEYHFASVIRITAWPAATCDNVIAWIDLDRGGPCGGSGSSGRLHSETTATATLWFRSTRGTRTSSGRSYSCAADRATEPFE